jgi:hypothetical protein
MAGASGPFAPPSSGSDDAGPGRLPLLRAATDPGAVGGALYTPRWVTWRPPIRRPLFGRSRNRDASTTL